MPSRGTRFRSVVFALLLVGMLVASPIGSAVPAQASPWNCPVTGLGKTRATRCLAGSGEYRIAIYCISWLTLKSTGRFVYGPWITMSYARPSEASCSWSENVGSAYPQTR